MAIETEVTVELARVEVSDTYQLELTVRDALTGQPATAPLTWEQTQQLMDELQEKLGEASAAFWEDRAARPIMAHGFDQPAVCADCREGKHGACIGTALTERGAEIITVACLCTADGHRGRS